MIHSIITTCMVYNAFKLIVIESALSAGRSSAMTNDECVDFLAVIFSRRDYINFF